MFHMQLSKLVGVAQAAKKDGSLAAGKPSAKTMSMLERCEKPALWYRMERLKRHGLALAAVQQDGMALKLQNKLIRRDRGIVLAAVKQNGMALQFADPDRQENLNRDREIVMTAVGSNGLALEFVDYSLRRDRDVVLLAVRSHGGALEFASAKLKRDKILVLYACREHIDALQFAAVELQDDAAFVHRAVRENKRKLRFMDQKARASVKKKWNSYIEDEGARAAAWNQPDPIQKIHVEHWALQLDDRVRDAREKGIPVPSRALGKRFVKGQYIIC